jgi:hypothetical protein
MPRPKAVIGGTHTSIIDAAKRLVECALRDPYTTRVNPGIIEKTKKGAGGKYRVKFTPNNGGILMQVRGNYYVQKITIFTDRIQNTLDNLESFAKLIGYKIGHGESIEIAHAHK